MLERLAKLEENIARLREFRRTRTPERLQEDPFEEWALRYGLFESIQIVIDLACHLSARYNLGVSRSYAECIENLSRHDHLDRDLARRLVAAIGLRNLLIHEYVTIETDRLFGFLDHLEDFSDFVRQIKTLL